jgi:hypothetical protein
MTEDLLSVAQAAALLGVEPNEVWDRMQRGDLAYSTFQTARGISYLVARRSLQPEHPVVSQGNRVDIVAESSGSLPFAALPVDSQQQERFESFVGRLLEPLAARLESVSVELGAERRRREIAEKDLQFLEAKLEEYRDQMKSSDGSSRAPSYQEHIAIQEGLITELRQRSVRSEHEVEALSQRLSIQQSGLESAQAMEREVDRLQRFVQLLERTRATQTETISELDERAQHADKDIRELHEQLIRAKIETDELRGQLALRNAMQPTRDSAVRELEKLRQAIEVLQMERDAQASMSEELRTESERAEGLWQQSEKRADELAEQLSLATARTVRSERELQDAHGEMERLQQMIEVLEHDRMARQLAKKEARKRRWFPRRST